MQLATTLIKVVPLVIFGLVGIFYIAPGAYQPFNPSGQSLVSVSSTVAALTLWAFLGLESATVCSSTIKNPERNVPRATLMGMLIAGSVTILVCTVVLGLLPAADLQNSAAPMADAASRLWGPVAGVAVGVIAMISIFGALNGGTLTQAQAPLAAAQDGLFPKVFAKLDARQTPWLGLLISSVLASALVIANSNATLVTLFTFSLLLSTAAALLPYAICAAAWLRMNPSASKFKKFVAIAALIYSLWALIGTGMQSLIWGAGLLLAGVVVYLFCLGRK